MILALMQFLVIVFLCAIFFSIFVCPSVHLSVLLCSGSFGLIQINVRYYVCMYSISLVSSVVTLNTPVTEKVKMQ